MRTKKTVLELRREKLAVIYQKLQDKLPGRAPIKIPAPLFTQKPQSYDKHI